MGIEFDHLDPPASEKQIAQLQGEVRATLSEEFRDFLLRSNGGRPKRNEFAIKQVCNRSGIRLIYGIHPGEDGDLSREYKRFSEMGIDWLLPIGEDSFGNRIALAIRGDHAGAIYFWDHESFHLGARPKGVYLLADDFNQFLSMLMPAAPIVRAAAREGGWIDPDFLREQREKGNLLE